MPLASQNLVTIWRVHLKPEMKIHNAGMKWRCVMYRVIACMLPVSDGVTVVLKK